MTCLAKRHGTLYAYRKHRCRCPEARAAKAAESRRRQWIPRKPDPIAVELACQGEPVHLTPAERRQAVQHLTQQGRSQRWIAEQLRIARRTVVRHRKPATSYEAA